MKKLMMAMVLAPMMALGFAAMASTINVSGGGDALQKAINEAKAGDVLLVGPGTYSAIDTQGKEIEIRSTKGPKQTFLTGGAQRASLYASVAHLMSDEVSEQIGEGSSYRYDVLTEMQSWKPSDLPGSRLVGFTIKPTVDPLRPNGYEDNLYAVEGGRLENCIFPEVYFRDDFAYLSLSVAVNCLFVSGKLDGEIVGDSCLWNCTVVTKAYVCTAELKNTIVYSTGSRAMELDGPCPIYNSIFFNVSGQPSTDPEFIDMGHGDYSLSQDSPCIDAGNNAYVFSDTDLNGGARIVNGAVDIGAYEFGPEYSWIENQGGAVTITEIQGEIPDVLALPSELGGRPVSAIGPGVLSGDEEDDVVPSVKELIVPEGVRRIGEDSFSRCPYLAKIVLPKSLEEIGEGAFTAGADSLPFNDYKWKDYENFGIREIQVADGNESFEVKDGVLVDRKNGVAVVCCVNATSLSLPEGIREIGEHCFAYCQSLSAIWFPFSLQTIGKEAFMFCRQLKALDFSSTSLSQVGRNAFGGCVNLAGVKFPASLEDVGKNAFYWCNALRSVTYEGDAPSSAEEIYMTTNDDLATPRLLPDAQRKEMPLSKVVSYVPSDSTGWGEVPGFWQGCPVRHEPRIDLEHAYNISEGMWKGWKCLELEDDHEYGGADENPWSIGFSFDEEYGAQNNQVCIPVYECGVEKIKPVVFGGSATMIPTASVLTDAELAAKFGLGKYKFENDDEEYEYESDSSRLFISFPSSVWPQLKVVPDRQWIVVSLKGFDPGPAFFYSPWTFSVGVYGTDQMTPPITICPDHIEHEVHDGFYPKTLWGLDMTLNPPGDDDWTFEPEWGSIWCESEDTVGMRATYRIYTGEDDDEYGSLTLTVPSKGDVYIKLGREGDSDGCDDPAQLRLAGSVLDGGMRKVVDAATQDVWGIFSTVAGGRVTISGYGKRLYVYGICFRPDAVSEDGCIATEAWYREWMNCANDNVQSRYRCYVTGMGVTKFGDKTTLVCHPNDGEVFDHWEFVNCTAPKDATTNDIELSFTASQALYDEVGASSAGLRTVIVRPVLKPRRTIMIQTNPCGAAAVSGNGAYFKGEKATVVLDPVDGCIFRGWSDGDKSGLTRVFDIGDRDIVVSALFDGVPVYAPTVQTIIPGDKVDIYAGFIGYTASGLPSGLKYDKTSGMITGAATKPTAAEGVVVTFRKTGEPNETLTVVVGPIPTVDVRMEGVNSDSDIQGCKVTGAKAYLVGAKVTLKATAPKGTAFVGWFDGETAASKQSSYVFTMDKENVVLVAKFEKEVIAVDSGALAEGATFPAGVLGAEEGIGIAADAPSGVKSIAVSKLPSGMKFDAKGGNVITGAPTKPGDYTVQVKVTSNSGAVETREIKISVAAMPETAVGTFSGFVANGESRIGTLTLTATDAGKLTAKVVTASGTVSFAGTCWDSVEDGVYHVTLATKKGDFLTLALDTKAGWDANQLTGTFSPPNMTGWFDVSAQRNAFAQKWYFDATGNANDGWSFSFAQNAKAAALTVTLKADGSTAIAGMLPNGFDGKGKPVSIKVSASGYANVGAVRNGAIRAGFVPVVKVGSEKKALSISTNLWFDRGDNREGGAGSAVLAD